MNPNCPPPQPDPSSSSLAYLNHLPQGTQPHYRPVQGNPPRLRNAPAPDRALLNPQQDQMDIDTGNDTPCPARDASPDHEPGRGLKRARPDTSNTEVIEHSEPVCKQRRTEPPEPTREEPAEAFALLSPAGSVLNILQNQAIEGSKWQQINACYRTTGLKAAIVGNLDTLKYFVEQGCDIQQKDKDGMTALMYAAKNGHSGIVKYLVDIGCNYYKTNNEYLDAFQLAAIHGHLDVLKCLTEKGYGIRRKVRKTGKNSLMFAAQFGHLEIVKYLHKKGCDLHEKNNQGKNALMFAAKYGHLDVAKYIVEKYGDPNEGDAKGINALMKAATSGQLNVLKYFVENGGDIHQENDDNETATTLAAVEGHLDVVKYLIDKGGNINHVTSDGYNPLTCVLSHIDDIDLVEKLIRLGATVDTDDANTNRYLFGALNSYNPRLVNLLIPLHDVSKRDCDGQTPLMLAAVEDRVEVAVPLIQATLKLPTALQLIEEAAGIAKGSFFRELLRNPLIVSDEGSKLNSALQVDSEPFIFSAFISEYVLSQYEELQNLRTSLGSEKSITSMQIKSAKVSVLAELTAWKLHHPDENLFTEHLPDSLASVRAKVIAFINKDIEVLGTQALQWEQDHLIHVVENLYECCLNHALAEQSPINIISDLTAKGLFHPIAQKIAAAWTSTWANLSKELALMLKPAGATRIDQLMTTPIGYGLLQSFRAALRHEFDSVGGGILRAEGANLSEQSKALYADLIGRQLHLIAQFWRAES